MNTQQQNKYRYNIDQIGSIALSISQIYGQKDANQKGCDGNTALHTLAFKGDAVYLLMNWTQM